MTAPVLCVNCGKPYAEHHDWISSRGEGIYCNRSKDAQTWEPSGGEHAIDEHAIENRTAEQIAAWLESPAALEWELGTPALLARTIRGGAWRKP